MIKFENYQCSSYKNKIQHIYKKSFPHSERFKFSILKKCNRESNVRLDCILQDNKPIGMQFTIEIPHNITYLMYFAIDEEYRNQNIGSEVLEELITSKNKIMLIIEKPTDNLTERRKNFYLRNGFYSTNIQFNDTGVQYEVLISDKNYIPTKQDLLNRYRYMTNNKLIWNKIKKTFNVKNINFVN